MTKVVASRAGKSTSVATAAVCGMPLLLMLLMMTRISQMIIILGMECRLQRLPLGN
jgi:hypothetical protein